MNNDSTNPDKRRFEIGFSGTQDGMTRAQTMAVQSMLPQRSTYTLHHGDCVGADAQVHELIHQGSLAMRMGRHNQVHYVRRSRLNTVVIHPPEDDSKRAFCIGNKSEPPLPYLQRNDAIVDAAVDGLIAAPRGPERLNPRSGTWYTIRKAKRQGRFVAVVWPNGIVETVNGPRPW